MTERERERNREGEGCKEREIQREFKGARENIYRHLEESRVEKEKSQLNMANRLHIARAIGEREEQWGVEKRKHKTAGVKA